MINSLQNERVKRAHALISSAKARRKADQIAVEGARLLRDALLSGCLPEYILYDPDAVQIEAIVPDEMLATLALPASAAVIRHIADTETPQGVIGVFPTPAPALPKPLERVVILDAISDPGNLGTLLRTARAAGVQAVLLAPGSADAWSPKALRAGMGAHFAIPALEASWTRIALLCDGLHVRLADMTGDAAYDQADWRSPWALIVGSEAHGASEQAETLAHQTVFIPMEHDAESLNAAIAASVILFEAARQRRSALEG